MEDQSDKQEEASGDNRDLFIPLFLASERRLRAYVYGMVPSQQDVDEVMQEVSIVLWKKFDKFEPGTEFIRWAYAVARFEVLAYRRKKARDRLCFSEDLLEILANEYEEERQTLEDEREALVICLGRLPASEREIILTAYGKDLRINQIAEAAGLTASSLYKRLNRLRKRLLDCVTMKVKTA